MPLRGRIGHASCGILDPSPNDDVARPPVRRTRSGGPRPAADAALREHQARHPRRRAGARRETALLARAGRRPGRVADHRHAGIRPSCRRGLHRRTERVRHVRHGPVRPSGCSANARRPAAAPAARRPRSGARRLAADGHQDRRSAAAIPDRHTGERRRPADAALDYGSASGLPRLREAIAAHVSRARGTSCTAEQVVVVAGAQHGLHLLCQLLLDPGDLAWIEEPGYPGARSAMAAAAADVLPVPVDAEGLDVDRGRRRRRRPRLI